VSVTKTPREWEMVVLSAVRAGRRRARDIRAYVVEKGLDERMYPDRISAALTRLRAQGLVRHTGTTSTSEWFEVAIRELGRVTVRAR
jgi:DNA-binding HxlR family transcriptional regulator